MAEVSVVLGVQWGDEGKGKLVDLLSENCTYVCRCQGGNNAGHTVIVKGVSYFFHLVPSGIVNPSAIGIIGNGVVIHLPGLFAEIDENKKKGLVDLDNRLKISDRCHIVCDLHQEIDGKEEMIRGSNSIGTTKKGIGPTYSSKAARNGIRICDLMGDWNVFIERYNNLVLYMKRRYPDLSVNNDQDLEKFKHYRERLKGMVCDTVTLLAATIKQKGTRVMVEGAQSCLLDIDFGTYPFVTSSNCSIGGVCTGLGIPPTSITQIYGVVKAYTTRVGGGHFPTELHNDICEFIRKVGHEYGVTTGRPRRIGWLDIVAVNYAVMVCGFTEIALTKLDVLDGLDEILIGESYKDQARERITSFPANIDELGAYQVNYRKLDGWKCTTSQCTKYDDLPANAKVYIELVESLISVPIKWVGVGPGREAMIKRF